ncbi:MAG: CPBP family intramembrane metalloprotease [Ruminococcaceae bacterium]|nr:CPBP family intramembrane metalloprotease [Oscillospiraceae bacterium]
MENNYVFNMPDGRSVPVKQTWVYLGADGNYYPAPAESVRSEGTSYYFEYNQSRVPVSVQYVYTDANGLPTAAPADRVMLVPVAVAAAPAQPVCEAPAYQAPTYEAPATAAAAETAAGVYAAPAASVPAEQEKPVSRFRRDCERVGGSLLLYVLISTAAALVVIGLFAIPMIVAVVSDPSVREMVMEAVQSGADQTSLGMLLMEELPEARLLQTGVWVATIIGALLASTLPMFRIAKKSGFKAGSVFAKPTRVKGLNIKCYFAAMGITGAWIFIYAFLTSLIPAMQNSGSGMDVPQDLASIILYCFYVCICAPILEEFIFRGMIFKSLSRYGVVFAAITNSLLFGLLHGNLQQAPFAALIGIVFSYAALRTGSIRLPILLHFGVNFFSTLVNVLYSYIFPEQGDLINGIYLVFEVIFIIAGIITLIACRKQIVWSPENPETCATALPYEGGEVKAKGFHFATCGLIILFIGYCLFSIVASMGIL